MIPVDQRRGEDCLHACVASMFEMRYEEVPQFGGVGTPEETKARGWKQDLELAEWLRERGLGFLRLPEVNKALATRPAARLPWGIAIAEGPSPRGDWDHACLYDCRDKASPVRLHDPHTSRMFFAGQTGTIKEDLERITNWMVLVVVEPARLGG